MSPNSYLDFDLLIESSDAGYRAEVVDSPAGQAAQAFTLPFSESDLELFVHKVFRLTTRRSVRAIGSTEMTDVRSFGGHLFESLFAGPVSTCLLRSMDEADRNQAGLRIRLRLGEAPGLANIPWEFLYDGASDGFLCLSADTPVVRYMDLPQRVEPLAARPPLRMLTLISSPAGYPPLDVQREWAKLNEALGPITEEGRLVMDRVETPTLEALQRRLRREEYHILHFIGHGAFDEGAKDGVLLLEDLEGKGHPVSGESLGVLLHDHDSLRLVLLNACEGARTSTTDPFAGTAQSLVRRGIPAVIAMQFEISDVAAITLANEFYAALADGFPVDGALSEARKAIFTRVNAVEWATPVLYMRSPDGRIFEIEDQDERLATRETRRIVVEPSPPPLPIAETPATRTPVPVVEPTEKPEPSPRPAADIKPTSTAEPPTAPRRPSAPATGRPPANLIRVLSVLAVVVVLAVATFFIARALTGSPGGDSPQTRVASVVAVPDVTGLDEARAEDQLAQLGFRIRQAVIPSRTIPEGEVIRTTPVARTKATKGSDMVLTVSSGDWIAVTTNRDGNSEIYLVRPDESGREVNLTKDAAFDGYAAWSPDGSRIAFASTRDDPDPLTCGNACNYEIYVMNSDGTGVTRVTDSRGIDGFPTWSPDGKRIAFESNRDDPRRDTCSNENTCNFNIYVMGADGSGLKRLTSNRRGDMSPRWSPVGDVIAFRSNRTGNYQIYTMSSGGKALRRLTSNPYDEVGPAWSPDGGQIAFRSDRTGNYDIWVMNADGSGQTQLTHDPRREAQPTWSPDGRRIAFVFGPQGEENIAVVNADGSGFRILTENHQNYDHPRW